MTYRDAICAVHSMTYDQVCQVRKSTTDRVLYRFARLRLQDGPAWRGVRDACLGYTPPPADRRVGGNNRGKQFRPVTTYAAVRQRMQQEQALAAQTTRDETWR